MKIIALIALSALAGPAFADDEVAISDAKTVVVRTFKDPDSAQFRNIVIRDSGKRRAVCGEVNAKNSYGGYVGYRAFYVIEGDSKALIKRDDPIMDRLVDLVCAAPK